ncbi:hypothetical protein SAMN05443248_3518 [Bradyrhizobium erythrophlei]|jgi:hypothetical protein|uniref:Uncharacterized protein n=1 Tax=Bradyrhizobium erythrophlei TaxID=1437360 RepID=A0A1M5PW85_9BRAD|nr:hypothetical protein SAMN05443248_3518 [Bradyrhizobium erythrophlei]
MPFPFSIFLFSYVIWQASIEQAFALTPTSISAP